MSINYHPNFTTIRRNPKKIKYIIFHYTGMRSENKAINRLLNVKSKVSCHYFIKKNGQVIFMIPAFFEAWHAGKSKWKKDKSLNKYSIGIEIANKGHEFGYEKFSKMQILSLIKLSKYLINKYKINKKNILGHSDIAFQRKKDPGEKFPWKFLASKGVGIWHSINNTKLKKLRKFKLTNSEKLKGIKFLEKIGYSPNKEKDKNCLKLIKSFQRRFRQELIDGRMDKECLIIAKKLSKTYN
jgi:N-acetylmuramoyl-L-alanine amidase